MDQVEFHKASGEELKPWLVSLAQLRIRVFYEFPYLYDGDYEYEKNYLQTYINTKKSLVILATHNSQVIGASTCLPLRNETEEFKKPFLQKEYDISNIFYFGESILLPDYRGQGIGHRFFQFREEWAQDITGSDLKWTCFCAVQRPEDHPLKPQEYKPLHSFWHRRGYQERPELSVFLNWKDRDQEKEDTKKLNFWMKKW